MRVVWSEEGKVDKFSVVSDRREYRKFTYKMPRVRDAIGDIESKRKAHVERRSELDHKMEMDRLNHERLRDEDRNLSSEQAVIDNRELEIRTIDNQVASFDVELERLKYELKECESATLSKYRKQHEIPADAKLEIEIRWPLGS